MIDPGTLIVSALLILVTVLLAAWMIRGEAARRAESIEQAKSLAALEEQLGASSRETSQRMDRMAEAIQTVHLHMARAVEAGRKSVDDRLNTTTHVIQSISTQLGQLGESSKNLLAMSRDVAELQNILRAPKLRGNLGELLLGELLAQTLPADQFSLQHSFRSGEKVDAVIRLESGVVPIDSKFPLENFRKYATATRDEDRRALRRTFLRDVKTHVDAIAAKYIRPDEGTYPFALMYIPAENVYYEAILHEEETDTSPGLLTYAMDQRVIPVSPGSFYSYLQTILLGLRGFRVEERAGEIIRRIDRLGQELDTLRDTLRIAGNHLDSASRKFEEADRQLARIETSVDGFSNLTGSADLARDA